MISRIALDAKGVTPGDPEVDHRIRPRLTNQTRYFLRCLPSSLLRTYTYIMHYNITLLSYKECTKTTFTISFLHIRMFRRRHLHFSLLWDRFPKHFMQYTLFKFHLFHNLRSHLRTNYFHVIQLLLIYAEFYNKISQGKFLFPLDVQIFNVSCSVCTILNEPVYVSFGCINLRNSLW